MTKDEFAYWQSRIENSRIQWTEDVIFRHDGRGAFYYIGDEYGMYIKINKDGLVEAGTYEDAFPHIGDACFTVKAKRQCKDYNEAFAVAMEAGGMKFLTDMFSADVVPPPVPTEKPSVMEQIKAARQAQSAAKDKEPQDIILPFDDFVTKCRMLDEACRQWCAIIDEAPERRDGEYFIEFYAEICEQKYQEYLEEPSYRADCNYTAEKEDKNKSAQKHKRDKGGPEL